MHKILIFFTAVFVLLVACQINDNRSEEVPITAVDGAPDLESLEASVEIKYLPAEELPQQPADIRGGFLSQNGERITVGSGFVDISPNGEGGYRTKHDGPLVEVQTTDQTRYWADVTQTGAGQVSRGNITLQQIVEAVASPVELPYPAFISVWGQWQDEIFVADDILFDIPGD